MNEYKIVFTGTTGAGKTTAIGAVSETAPINTDVLNSDLTVEKMYTTVGLDYGQISLANGDRVRLFGTPGQTRFDFMWKILAKDALGMIILIDNSRPNPFADLDLYLTGFANELQVTPCVIGVGRMESDSNPSVDDFSSKVEEYGLTLPVLAVDVRKNSDVKMLINMIIAQVEADLN